MKIGLFLLLVSLTLEAQGPVPRPAPDLRIVEASGKPTMLSELRGRVVLLSFISTQCSHCQRASMTFEQLSHEFASDLQVAEVAFERCNQHVASAVTVYVVDRPDLRSVSGTRASAVRVDSRHLRSIT